ncbi:hypothetical protein LXA43DRAFT_977125 [Ganoderma leucocontextum]|nr:hypothetical protein LXA43DRAFT_977125 [Ganoderma leucocontextum]
MKSLPPEIWGLVVNELGRSDQRTSLALSKLHHDFAVRSLFAHITIYFGQWMPDHITATTEELHFQEKITLDILRHIQLFPEFASLVKKISIQAYLHRGYGTIVRTEALIATLQALPNLRAFHWYGDSPELSADVLTALARSPPGPSLKKLHIPITMLTEAAISCLSAFSGLQELCTIDDCFYDPPLSHGRARALQIVVNAMSPTLTRIALGDGIFWGCSIQSMLALQELELLLPETTRGLSLVFQHCSSLRSLTLFPEEVDEPFSVLQAHPTALPELRALKYIHHFDIGGFENQHAEILARFIKNKKRLVSLDLEIEPAWDAEGASCDEPLLEAIRELPHLEVLGFYLTRSTWEPGDIQLFRDRLPRRLTALRVNVAFESQAGVFLQDWLGLIKDLSSLRYLHISDPTRTFDVRQQLLHDPGPPASLELLGYGPFVRWLVRGHASDDRRPTRPPCWPASKVRFRCAEDFGCAEWEWLLRWHGFGGIFGIRRD